MKKNILKSFNRRCFIKTSLGGIAFVSIPISFKINSRTAYAKNMPGDSNIKVFIRKEVLFAGIRKPIKKREELEPRIEKLKKVCGNRISGPLTHIFRFDTPVDGFDSEIGFPVSSEINIGDIKTHKLRTMYFYTLYHKGPIDSLGKTSSQLYQYMNKTGLSPELEYVEVYHKRDLKNPDNNKIEVMASFLAWPEVYRKQLIRVLGENMAEKIWKGGEKITPHTLVDERCAWVAESIARLKQLTNMEQQFDILSRVALIRPIEDVQKYKKLYEETKDINAIFQAKNSHLQKTRSGGYIDPPKFDGKILHMSKVSYNKDKYMKAKTHKEKRKAYCFCNLVREADNPQIDPIFCYRAAGWDRQFWEPILEVEFKKCRITHSILKGDDFCAWDFYLE